MRFRLCCVFASCRIPHGPAFAALTLVEAGKIELLLSREILAEINDVLLRPQVAKKFPHLSLAVVQSFLRQLENIGCWVENVPQTFRLDRDPDDEPYINLAIVGGAQYLVSRDRDLLDLVQESSPEGARLRLLAPELRILDPVDLLRKLPR